MNPLRAFLRHSPSRRLLLLRALGTVMAMRVGLLVLPFRTLRHLVARVHIAGRKGQSAPSAEMIAWSIAAVSRYVPRATCLTQALAARVMLARAGHGSSLRIGVGRTKEGKFESHAWVEHEGRTIIGGTVDGTFTPLWDLDMRPS